MRILLIAEPNASKNGWSRYASALCEALISVGDEARVLGWSPNQEKERGVSFSEFGLWSAFFKPWLFVRGWKKVKASLQDWMPEVVHVTVEPYLLYGALIAGFYGIPLVLTTHGTYADPSGVFKGWKQLWVRGTFRFALKRCRQVVCVSRFTEAFFLERWPFMKGRTEVVAPGYTVLAEGSEADREAFLAASSFTSSDQPLLLVVGAVKERRGQLEAVQILARVRLECPTAKLLLMGSTYDIDYVRRVEEEIRRQELQGAVSIRSDVTTDLGLACAYQLADVLLMPSKTGRGRFEGFGLVALEANQFGTPVVAMAGSGVEDAVIPGVTGVLVPANDVEASARATINLIQRPLPTDRIRQSLLTRSWAQTAKRIHSLYVHLFPSAR